MIKQLLKRLLRPIIEEILEEQGFKPKYNGYDGVKYYYTKWRNNCWLNIITNHLITDDEYKRLKG